MGLLQRHSRARSVCSRHRLRTRIYWPAFESQYQRTGQQYTTHREIFMKLLKYSIKARILWLLASCVALLLSSPAPGFQAQKNRDENISITRWEHSDNGLKRRLEVRGKAEFTDDYTDVKDVSAGGWVIIEEHRDGQSF